MSRSTKGKTSPGSEYWGKRPISRNHGAVPGRETKTLTHRLERLEGKKEVAAGLIEDTYDPREYISPEDNAEIEAEMDAIDLRDINMDVDWGIDD